jgi:hypothetical protein
LHFENVQQSEYNQFRTVLYTVATPGEVNVGQRNLIACAERDGLLAYLHVSKAAAQPADQLLFDALLSSVSLSDGDVEAPPQPRQFPVSGSGYFECNVPASWRTWMQPPAPNQPSVISMAPPDGHEWEIQITVMTAAESGPSLRGQADLHRLEEENRQLGMQAGRQPTSAVEDFASDQVIGSFYAATLPAVPAAAFNSVATGVARTGGLIFTFTVSARTPDARVFAPAMRVIGSARHLAAAQAKQQQDHRHAGGAPLPGLGRADSCNSTNRLSAATQKRWS